MKHEITQAISSHPVSTGVATAAAGLPIIDLLDYASSLTTLIAGVTGIAVSYFLIQNHRSNIKINEYRLERMKDRDDGQ